MRPAGRDCGDRGSALGCNDVVMHVISEYGGEFSVSLVLDHIGKSAVHHSLVRCARKR